MVYLFVFDIGDVTDIRCHFAAIWTKKLQSDSDTRFKYFLKILEAGDHSPLRFLNIKCVPFWFIWIWERSEEKFSHRLIIYNLWEKH